MPLRNPKVLALVYVAAMLLTGCGGVKVELRTHEDLQRNQKKTLLLPTFGIASDDKACELFERAILTDFKPLPGSQIAKSIGLYDKVRPKWEEAVKGILEDPSGVKDMALAEGLALAGKATGFDSVFVSGMLGTAKSYDANEDLILAMGLWDVKARAYVWLARIKDRKGKIPMPFTAFVARMTHEIKGAVDASAEETSGEEDGEEAAEAGESGEAQAVFDKPAAGSSDSSLEGTMHESEPSKARAASPAPKGGTGSLYLDAMNDYRRRLKSNPNDPQAWWGMGNLYLQAGQRKYAIDCFKRYTLLDPSALLVREWLRVNSK